MTTTFKVEPRSTVTARWKNAREVGLAQNQVRDGLSHVWLQSCARLLVGTALIYEASLATAASLDPAPTPPTWSVSASLALKESYDDNLLLQDVTTNAFQEAFITTLIPKAGLSFKPDPGFGADLCYSPEMNFIHSSREEDFTSHRTGLNLGGQSGSTAWKVVENFLWIDGSDEGPSFFGPGGPPAGGGPQIRDRRDAIVQRGSLEVKQSVGEWFVRPILTGYLHDFRTEQRSTPGYQNYVDRSDWNLGTDVGIPLVDQCWIVAGYRFGEQGQATLFDDPVHYDSSYHRALAGIEGKPWPWLQLAVSMGPEFRRYGDSVAPDFESRNEVYLYSDASAVISPTGTDSISISARRFEQPGFGGRSTYIDSTYDLFWKHKLGPKLVAGAGLRGYQTKFLGPASRNDWIVTPSALLAYALRKDLTLEATYVFDKAYSLVPDTAGREYRHQIAALGVRYVFR